MMTPSDKIVENARPRILIINLIITLSFQQLVHIIIGSMLISLSIVDY